MGGYANIFKKVGEPAPTSGDYLVRFIDFDGTILKEQWVNAGQAATAPTPPTHEYLTFDEWNNDFANIQHDLDVGAIYRTTDGKTYLFMRFTNTTGIQPSIVLNKATTAQMNIDWGDGTGASLSGSGNITITKAAPYAAIGDYTITIECVGNWSFYTYIFNTNASYNSCLLECYLGDSVTSIAGNVFRQCYSLTSIVIPDSVTSIAGSAFYNCYSLTSIVIPDGVTSIGTYAFYNCYSLNYLRLSYNITTIDNYSFLNALNLKKIIIEAVTPPTLVDVSAFSNLNLVCKIYVPDASVSAYQAATNWVTYASYIYPISELAEYAGTIFFQSNGGSAIKQIKGTVGAVATAPTAPTKAGVTFAGWYKEAALTNAWNWASDVYPSTNITLYAKWV